ncbi:hypothetical protein OG709_02010 [Streptomyces sp. NBC_01267]|uniref:DUF6882 domain-containing protein n=1 Tax=unclassified Streptomyces TaxID=2593676 RepID=UPI002E2F0DD3|nr:DUF6882 domain-containing protein [Streptomyces sp. NBC_01267]WSV58110.1 hypothetical protein OG282_32900 [Streptomyces sp. NBC_01014]
MGLFKRNSRPDGVAAESDQTELSTLLLQGEDMIEQLAQAHMSWGLGSADRWGLDQRTGIITWTFPDKTATAPAQIIGSYNPSAASWLWAWANESILPEMSRDARTVRDWAKDHGHLALTQPKVDADEGKAATLAALALRITEATGFYRGTGSTSIPIITFGAVTLTAEDGTTSTFKIDIG